MEMRIRMKKNNGKETKTVSKEVYIFFFIKKPCLGQCKKKLEISLISYECVYVCVYIVHDEYSENRNEELIKNLLGLINLCFVFGKHVVQILIYVSIWVTHCDDRDMGSLTDLMYQSQMREN
jgi:hypothetical protein